jgi:2-amino-4-hydroxy-6-hydroxymethyldihydropteridine diphosphokinase
MKTAYLGLGSNLGEREANLARARELLASERLTITRASSVYETAPRDVLDQSHFLNQVIEIETDLFPRQLLAWTQKVEREMGRVKLREKGPRVIDVDVLLYGSAVVNSADLVIPHAALAERRFVLEPLAELAPELRHPVTRRTVREMLAGVADQVVRRT